MYIKTCLQNTYEYEQNTYEEMITQIHACARTIVSQGSLVVPKSGHVHFLADRLTYPQSRDPVSVGRGNPSVT
eukprot:COSAG05_NODE_180_length_14817_cov_423.925262_10_plen_73_part_00